MFPPRAKVVTITVKSYNGGRKETVETILVDTGEDASDSFRLLLDDIRFTNDRAVAFDTKWVPGIPCGPFKIAMLKFCTKKHCVLVRVEPASTGSISESVRKFLACKDVKFVGIRIKNALERLRRDYGVVVGNSVDLSERAAAVSGKPGFATLGARELAGELGITTLCRSMKVEEVRMSYWRSEYLSLEQIHNVTIDVYAAYEVSRLIFFR